MVAGYDTVPKGQTKAGDIQVDAVTSLELGDPPLTCTTLIWRLEPGLLESAEIVVNLEINLKVRPVSPGPLERQASDAR